MALYLSHIRIWGIVAADRKGKPALLLGGQPSKYRENFERKFHELTDEVQAVLTRNSSGKFGGRFRGVMDSPIISKHGRHSPNGKWTKCLNRPDFRIINHHPGHSE